jgi:NADH dehydrogenase FAD-containing subunit
MTGYEHTAFIPYDGVASGASEGIFTRIQDTAVQITQNQVLLASGQKVDYSYLAIATGSSQPLPVQVLATERGEACNELQGVQESIKASQRIAIVGGGPVGVELASDIKDFYPDKDVTLIHSRGQLLNNFGKRLQDYALKTLQEELKVRVLLNERPEIPKGENMAREATLRFSDGHEEEFDLIVSGALYLFSPLCILYSFSLTEALDRLHRTATQLIHSGILSPWSYRRTNIPHHCTANAPSPRRQHEP